MSKELFLFATFLVNLLFPQIGQKQEIKGVQDNKDDLVEVTKVIDGDTFEIETGEKVRLIGVNTPESVDPRRKVQCFGKEADNFTKSNLEGKFVKLEKDISEVDKYGRLLRYVWLDGNMVNEELVKQGFAQVSTYPPDVKYKDKFITAQNFARENKIGLWSKCK